MSVQQSLTKQNLVKILTHECICTLLWYSDSFGPNGHTLTTKKTLVVLKHRSLTFTHSGTESMSNYNLCVLQNHRLQLLRFYFQFLLKELQYCHSLAHQLKCVSFYVNTAVFCDCIFFWDIGRGAFLKLNLKNLQGQSGLAFSKILFYFKQNIRPGWLTSIVRCFFELCD